MHQVRNTGLQPLPNVNGHDLHTKQTLRQSICAPVPLGWLHAEKWRGVLLFTPMTKIIETPACIYIQGKNGAPDIEISAYICDYTFCKIVVTPLQVGKKFYYFAQAISLQTGYVMHTALRLIDFSLPFSSTASWVAAECFEEISNSHSDGLWIEHNRLKKNGRG